MKGRPSIHVSTVAEEIQRLKFKRLQAESKIARARHQLVSAELDIRVIDHCIKALSEPSTKPSEAVEVTS